jgi:hypothetical protein
MSRKSDGTGVGGLIFAIFILIAMIPKEVWIACFYALKMTADRIAV